MRRSLRRILTTATTGALVAVSLVAIGPNSQPVQASSHREAPLISQDPTADNTDVYAFVDPNDRTKVNFIANFIPFEEPAGGPNFDKFDDTVLYEIKVDNNGDANPDIVFQFRFQTMTSNPNTFLYNTNKITSLRNDPNWNVQQVYSVTMVKNGVSTVLDSNDPTPPANVGPRSTPNYAALAMAAVQTFGTPGGVGKVFCGARDEGFFVDLGSLFDLLGLREGLNMAHIIPLPNQSGAGNTDGFNVHSIILQMPISTVTANGTTPTSTSDPNAVIGVYSTASRQAMKVLNTDGTQTYTGTFVQVSRQGNPLVNEVVIPLGSKDKFNASQPSGDAQFLSFVQDPEPARLIKALYNVDVPPAPRSDLVQVFLTGVPGLNQPANVVPSEQMRLNVAVPPTANPNPLGVIAGDMAGFPNGRRVGDDVVDIELRVLAGVLVSGFNKAPNNMLGDGVNSNDRPYLTVFPYLAHPVSGYDSPHFMRRTTIREGQGTSPN